ncbi:uncharacterized protein CC84DRAFT_8366 [Paraphaeosphaeria sporulosa]|uniref:Uncharacterized protein n=1 Tax=Paraphaeosphaeria sporulosa TaxID=1460663 RepID=A0A177CWA6_9PLEO|nr:uncharacterized protein CC84DRAFT_8366 [Paraphaeosphaeria sporulosa]OAG11318.1 hypothetical protein CC84DRAFT_8366 [Paraphaeosphaeria sporulosa]
MSHAQVLKGELAAAVCLAEGFLRALCKEETFTRFAQSVVREGSLQAYCQRCYPETVPSSISFGESSGLWRFPENSIFLPIDLPPLGRGSASRSLY